MKKILFFWPLIFSIQCSTPADSTELTAYKEQAARVTIIRDNWGIPHIYGKTDADAVFGLMYAQCEESFERVERNYLQVMGRMAEVEGESWLYGDLKARLIYDTAAAVADYRTAPPALKKLLLAFAAGINYYLYKHPGVKPAVLTRFEPWFPLLFTDGAYIATNTGGLQTSDVKALYGGMKPFSHLSYKEDAPKPTGSNGFAIAPSRSATGNALLYINPHVSFYFRTEVHLVSEEGLNAYGAATWGQFFIFQGFNEHCGWMHTSSMADAADLYEEKVSERAGSHYYEYEGAEKPVEVKTASIRYKKGGGLTSNEVPLYYTHHGPVMGSRNDRWLSLKANNRSLNGLLQSWQRMKATSLAGFKNALQQQGNASTNTMYADDRGNIAYWHGNFMPRRDTAYDWSEPVTGATAATEWKGIHPLTEIISMENPAAGFLQNCNSSPFSVAGFGSLSPKKYPAYMAPEGENFRSLRAIDGLQKEQRFTMEKLVRFGYDSYLSLFDSLLPPLFKAFDALPVTDTARAFLAQPVALLRAWDKRSAVSSVATTLAVFWAYNLITIEGSTTGKLINDDVQFVSSVVAQTTSAQKLAPLISVVSGLQYRYGTWQVPWGNINRYQRTGSSVTPAFDDAQPSLPVGMASSFFGSLPAYEAVWKETKKQYGVAGNSFVAVVEFGKKVKARSIITGGQSFDRASTHFNDQAAMFIDGKFKEVLFYKEDVVKHTEKSYHPGEENQ